MFGLISFFSTVKAYLRAPQKSKASNNCHITWQNSYRPFQHAVITSDFIMQDQVETTKSNDYFKGYKAIIDHSDNGSEDHSFCITGDQDTK